MIKQQVAKHTTPARLVIGTKQKNDDWLKYPIRKKMMKETIIQISQCVNKDSSEQIIIRWQYYTTVIGYSTSEQLTRHR